MNVANQQCVVNCPHTVTRGKEGEKGSWCESCGEKVMTWTDANAKTVSTFLKPSITQAAGSI